MLPRDRNHPSESGNGDRESVPLPRKFLGLAASPPGQADSASVGLPWRASQESRAETLAVATQTDVSAAP